MAYQNLGKREIVGNVISEPNNLNYDLERKSVLDFESGYHVSNGDLSGKEIKKFLDVLDNNVDETSESDLIKIEENNQSQGIIVELSEEPAAEVTNSLTYKTEVGFYNFISKRNLKAVQFDQVNVAYKEGFFGKDRIKKMFGKRVEKIEKQQNEFINNLNGRKEGIAFDASVRLSPETDKKPIRVEKIAKIVGNLLYIPDLEYNKENEIMLKELGAKKVFPNIVVHASLDESVPMIGAPDAWNTNDVNGNSLDGTGTVVAVLDTGIDYTHHDLGGCLGAGCKVMGGYDFINGDGDPMDDHGHGTHVAATVSGIGPQGLIGVAPGAKLVAYKVLNAQGSGSSGGIIEAIERAMDPNEDGDYSDHVDVITMSLGGSGNSDDPMSRAIDRASEVGIVSSIAAGNSGPNEATIGSPGTSRSAITVAAACKANQGCKIADFSSRGPVYDSDGNDLSKPDVAAPGVKICAARTGGWFPDRLCKDDNHIAISGTSMATPHVAGTLAIIKQAFPQLTPSEIKYLIKSSAIDLGLSYNEQGAGLINITKMLKLSGGNFDRRLLVPSKPYINLAVQSNKKIYFGDVNFTIKNEKSELVEFRVVPDMIDGIDLVTISGNVRLNPGESREIFVHYTVDLDKLKTGAQNTKLNFLSGDGKNILFIPFYFNIPYTVKVDGEVHIGNFPKEGPSQLTGEVKIINLREDKIQEMSLNISSLELKSIG